MAFIGLSGIVTHDYMQYHYPITQNSDHDPTTFLAFSIDDQTSWPHEWVD